MSRAEWSSICEVPLPKASQEHTLPSFLRSFEARVRQVPASSNYVYIYIFSCSPMLPHSLEVALAYICKYVCHSLIWRVAKLSKVYRYQWYQTKTQSLKNLRAMFHGLHNRHRCLGVCCFGRIPLRGSQDKSLNQPWRWGSGNWPQSWQIWQRYWIKFDMYV